MKVPPTPIESTNPFADAAGAGLSPLGAGLGDNLGQVSTAWRKAANTAQCISAGAAAAQQTETRPVSQVDTSAALIPVPSLTNMADQPAPMGAQWDRLSMTVASLVAWNLISEVAPDSVEDLATPPMPVPGASIPAETGGLQVETAVSTGTAPAMLAAAMSVSVSTAQQTLEPASLTQAETISTRIAGQTGTAIHEDLALREATMLVPDEKKMPAPEGVRHVPTSIESEPTTSSADGFARAGTMADTAAHNQSYGPMALLDPEIPTSLQAASAQVAKAGSPAPSAVFLPELGVGLPVSEAQSSTQSAAHIKQVAARAEVPVPATATELARDPAPQEILGRAAASLKQNLRSAPVPEIATNGKTSEGVAYSPGDAAPSIRQPMATSSDAPVTQQSSQPVVDADDAPAPQAFKPSILEGAAPQEYGKMGRQTSLPSEPVPMSDPLAPAANGGTNIGSMTQTISDLERNFSVNESVFDSENISAEEVQELPLGDNMQFDIDIDDPDGKVRMDLTRRAEEVAIRLETPEEILEEYKDLRDEIKDALEDAGLSLADYEASSDSDSEERSDDSRGQAPAEAQDRASGPEETTGQGRLLNRIV